MQVKVVKVLTPPEQLDLCVVLVPEDYCNSAASIDAVAKAMGIREPRTWSIIPEQCVVTVNI